VSTVRSESLYFGSAGRESFAWLHRVEHPASVGLVICSSFGREDLCLHRSLRHFAQSAASAGIAALRFDYPGSGDSAGSEFAPDLVATWISSVADAVKTLKEQTGVTDVCLLGVRLGTLLAACAASRCQDIAGLVAIAPVTSGRSYVREMRAYSLAATSFGCKVPAPRPDHLLEAGGFAMDLATQESLSHIDLMMDSAPPAYPTLIVERDDLPANDRWLEHLRSIGAIAKSVSIPGYSGMVRESTPQHTEVPAQMIESVVSWVGQLQPRVDRLTQSFLSTVRISDRLTWSSPGVPDLVEQVVNIGADSRLTALITRSAAASSQRAIVLLSGGADRRIGPGRLYVRLAREWAAKGFVALRLDVSGIGDSPPPDGFEENVPYQAQALDDVDAAVRYLHETHRVSHCQLVGHCSGAYNAFRSAVAGAAVDAIVMINPLLYLSVGDAAVDLIVKQTVVVQSVRGYRRNLSNWSRWCALATDPAKVLRVLCTVLDMLHAKATRRLRDTLRMLGVQFRDDLPTELLTLAKQNVQLRLVFADGEYGESLLWSLGGATVKRLLRSGKLTITASEGADHSYTLLQDRDELSRTLTTLVDAPASVEAQQGSTSAKAIFDLQRDGVEPSPPPTKRAC